MKRVAETLGVSRSQLAERVRSGLKGRERYRKNDAEESGELKSADECENNEKRRHPDDARDDERRHRSVRHDGGGEVLMSKLRRWRLPCGAERPRTRFPRSSRSRLG